MVAVPERHPKAFKSNCWPIFIVRYWRKWARDGAVGGGNALQAGRSQVLFPMVSLEFFIDIILLAALLSLQQK